MFLFLPTQPEQMPTLRSIRRKHDCHWSERCSSHDVASVSFLSVLHLRNPHVAGQSVRHVPLKLLCDGFRSCRFLGRTYCQRVASYSRNRLVVFVSPAWTYWLTYVPQPLYTTRVSMVSTFLRQNPPPFSTQLLLSMYYDFLS